MKAGCAFVWWGNGCFAEPQDLNRRLNPSASGTGTQTTWYSRGAAFHVPGVTNCLKSASTEEKRAIATLGWRIHRKGISDTEKISVLTEVAQLSGGGAKKPEPRLITIAPQLLGECRATTDGKVPFRHMCSAVIVTKRVMHTLQSSARK